MNVMAVQFTDEWSTMGILAYTCKDNWYKTGSGFCQSIDISKE